MQSIEVASKPLLLGESRQLFGILTTPNSEVSNTAVVFLNAGLLHNVGPFRLSVDLANALGHNGFPTVRIDQSGKGESPARLNKSRKESVLLDFDETFDALSEIGIENVVLVGLCSGADDAIYIASERSSVSGLVLLDGYARKSFGFYVRRYGPKVLSVRRWLNKLRSTRSSDPGFDDNFRDWDSANEMIARYEDLLDRGTRILAVFTRGQDYYNKYGQLRRSLAKNTKVAYLKELYFKESDHTYTATVHRRRVISDVSDWTNQHFRTV